MKAIGEEFGPYETSHKVESDPWGFDSTNRFVNIGLTIESADDPEKVLCRLLGRGSHMPIDQIEMRMSWGNQLISDWN